MSIHKRLRDLYELNNIIAKGSIKTDIYKLLLDFIDINGEKEFIEYFNKIIIYFKSSKYYTIGNHLLNSINSFLDINDFILNIDNIKGGIKNNNINEFYNELHIFIINQLELYVPIEIEEKEIKKDDGKKKPTRKKSISSTMKKLIWNTHIGEEIGKSKCLCCKNTYIYQISFHCGHIIPESIGGETIVSNLRPICQNFNSSMGKKNMTEFMKTLL